MIRLLLGDCRERLGELDAGSVHTCVTSPPYFGLRDYGHAGQIGLESTPDAFVAEMVSVFREVRRVLRDDGTLWLNLGDSYAQGHGGSSTMGNGVNLTKASRSAAKPRKRDDVDCASWSTRDATPKNVVPGLKPKDLMGMPWRVAFALQADGWWLRQDIIWAKPNPMPESVTDRCTKAHEYLFLLSKGPRYHFDAKAIAEASETFGRQAPAAGVSPKNLDADRVYQGVPKGDSYDRETRNKRSVWNVATQPFKEAHFATYPPELIEPCILAGCPAGGTVLDPFGGAGTTGLVADRLQRNAILIELNPDYAEIARKRLHGDAGMFSDVEAA